MKKRLLTDTEIKQVLDELFKKYSDDKSMLHFTTPFELLVATILSAQCTDVRVNKVTKKMFPIYSTPDDFATLSEKELQKYIGSCGLYKTKSKNIINTAKIIRDDFGGKVPQTMEELITLPGVGRKTANVVLYNAFDIPAIAVDTHVFRVSNRIGIVSANNVHKTEQGLRERIPQKIWGKAHHVFIQLGRDLCKARNPLCDKCLITTWCRYYNEEVKDHIND